MFNGRSAHVVRGLAHVKQGLSNGVIQHFCLLFSATFQGTLPDPMEGYFVNPTDLGVTHSKRTFTDVLAALNLAIDLHDNLKLRFAYGKNMQLLNLDQWGGGLTLQYGIVAGPHLPSLPSLTVPQRIILCSNRGDRRTTTYSWNITSANRVF